MGTNPITDESDGSEAEDETTMEEIFYAQLPYYLSIGMTPDEYWRGDNRLPRIFKKAQELRERRANNHAYTEGLYNQLAFASVQSPKTVKYPEEPFPLTEEEAEQIRERKFRKRAEAWKRAVIEEAEEG